MAVVTESEYKGFPILSLKQNADDAKPFSFGLKRARMMLAHLDDIRRFVSKHEGR